MEELVNKFIQEAMALKKSPDSVPWKEDEPWTQPFYSWNAQTASWDTVHSSPTSSSSSAETADIHALAVYSWNIDAILPFAEERMEAAFAYLQELTKRHVAATSTTAVVIKLQECVLSDLATITEKQWIRDSFYITDLDDTNWSSGAYGTTMLVDRRLAISSCFRLHYSKTRMERDALFVDAIAPSKPDKVIRICNTHLESLALEPPYRPAQMQLVARYMHAEKVHGGVVSGDFNAVQAEDDTLHSVNGLKDAYLELGGAQGDQAGCTWGQQALPAYRERFGLSRMDKVFFRGEGLKLQSLERFGADVVVNTREARDRLLNLGFEKAWVTDHLGVYALFKLASGLHL
ncbi:Endonuclease/exonuclease/phosphatase [Stachybotrys elegans]|uniref:Endonuclease/exonuclease/phosphatase n=1 Tax=Stachybotrys elegans TaxID=80388 RepID=A0A8K0SXT4_9HYPO|nr:Endonuclease/exonuclease/phosphatase [Stachybotrys elegans]